MTKHTAAMTRGCIASLFAICLIMGCAGDDETDDFKPDLTVSRIEAPQWICQGVPHTISVTIYNKGAKETKIPFAVRMAYGSTASAGDMDSLVLWYEWAGIGAISSKTYSHTFTFSEWPWDEVHLGAYVDFEEDVIEANETNNELAIISRWKRQPDLAVTITQLPTIINIGANFWVAFTVSNLGDAPSPTTVAEIAMMQPLGVFPWIWTDRPIPSLAPGETYNDNVYLNLASFMAYPDMAYLEITVDYTDSIAESNETNNTTRATFYAQNPPLPDLAVMIIQVPASIAVGTDFWLDYTVTNLGLAASPATVAGSGTMQPLGISTGMWPDRAIPSLLPGETFSDSVFLTLSASMVPVYPEWAYIAVGVDYVKLIVESDEMNNLYDAAFWAW